MRRKSVDEQLLEAEAADRIARQKSWQQARYRDLQATLREVGRQLVEEDEDHPALDTLRQTIDLIGASR